MTNVPKLTAEDVLRRYKEEELPDFLEMELNDVNQAGPSGTRPIHVAAVRGSIEELMALIDGGADVNAPGDCGATPLHDAAGQGHADIVKILLEHGASPLKKNDWNYTPADVALAHGRKDIADLLKASLTKVVLTGLPPGFLDDLPIEDQQAISAIIGKPILFVDFADNGRVELKFHEPGGRTHFLYVDVSFIRPAESQD